MPASSGDPISAALNHSLAASSKFSNDSDSLDTKLIGSVKSVLVTEIKYEETSSYNNNVLELKSKYIVLKPSANLENGDLKLKNGVTKVKEGVTDPKACVVPNSCSKTLTSVTKTSSLNSGSNKSEVVLPSPKKVLFPPEKIQLGWQSKSFPIGSGMVNMGNTCYLNSTLQALFHVPAFVNWILNDKAHKDSCENTTNGLVQSECLICAMLKTLRNSMENSASSNPIRPYLVYNKLKLICKRLNHGHQEDAHEFLRYLIESMDRSYLRFMQANNLDSYSKETTPLSQIFGGYLRTEVTCLECHYVSLTFQHFQDLLLDIRQSSTLDEALQAYFSRERLGDGEEAYKCEKCHKRVAAAKQFAVEKPPNVLCIQLKRFGIMGGKNSKHIQVQQNLDLTRFWVHRTKQPCSRLNYKMVSVVSHIGPASSCGHYTAIGQTSSNQFYLFDDSLVRPVSPHAVSGNNAYIVMYELNSSNPSINGTPNKVASENCTITRPSQASSSSSSSVSKLGPNPFAKRPASPVVNGTHSPSKSQTSNPLKAILSSPAKPTYSGSSPSPKNVQPSAQAGHKSLVPYLAESSDSESEATTSKQKVSLALTPVKNGFAKESSSSAKYSNCTSSAPSCKTSTLNVSCKSEKVSDVVVNGWHVTEVTEQRSPSDTSYSPPQNWNVVDTSDTKSSEKNESSSHAKLTNHCNGMNGKDSYRKPLENGHSAKTNGSAHTTTNGSSRVEDSGRISNGKSWDGNRNNGTVDFLRKNSHQGYGSNVTSWNGSRSQVDREAANDRLQQRKRSYDQMYDEDLDQGKMKKMKPNNHYQMKGVREINGRRNLFQEHQNHKNNWFGDRNHFYNRTYNNNHHYRTYQNNNRNPNYNWRRN